MRESEVFLMRNTKRELNPYSFYDTEGLARHFERMAAEGWAPDRVGLFIRYRRIKPQKLRFAVAFYPDSDDTPEGEDVFIDYCEQAGWQHAVGAGALTFWGGNVDGEGGSHSGRSRHVFCTADENAIEIDTDPVLQVDATHRGLKPYCHWLVAFSILLITQLDTIADGLRRDPFSGIASGARLVMLGLWMILIVICLSQCIGYYRWYGKAKQIAAKEGRFLRPKSRPWLQTLWRLILLLTIFSAVVVILMGNDTSGQARLYYVTLLIVCGPIAAAFFAYSSMERAGAKRGLWCSGHPGLYHGGNTAPGLCGGFDRAVRRQVCANADRQSVCPCIKIPKPANTLFERQVFLYEKTILIFRIISLFLLVCRLLCPAGGDR